MHTCFKLMSVTLLLLYGISGLFSGGIEKGTWGKTVFKIFCQGHLACHMSQSMSLWLHVPGQNIMAVGTCARGRKLCLSTDRKQRFLTLPTNPQDMFLLFYFSSFSSLDVLIFVSVIFNYAWLCVSACVEVHVSPGPLRPEWQTPWCGVAMWALGIQPWSVPWETASALNCWVVFPALLRSFYPM